MTETALPYPLTVLHFEVRWLDSQSTANFSEVSGLTMEADAIDYRGGYDISTSVQKIPGLKKYGNVSLKRGIMPAAFGNGLFEWYDKVKAGSADRRPVTITLLNEDRRPVMAWKLQSAWPVKIEGPGLKATGNEIAIETIELVHESLRVEVL